uniref:Transmembrane protein 245 n=1 Tax=Ciona savignyi TaxID=51511 RepID=H2ZC57_CIOSA
TVTTPRRFTRQPSVLLDSVTHLFPPSHEKPLKQALYTTFTFVVFGVICVVAASTYFVLQVFIKPLVWGALCGSFLFPFKYTLHKTLEDWLTKGLNNGWPLVLQVLFLPISLFAKLSDYLGTLIIKNWKLVLIFIISLVTLYGLHYMGLLSLLLNLFSDTVILVATISSFVLETVQRYQFIVLVVLVISVCSTFVFSLQHQLAPYLVLSLWFTVLIVVLSYCNSLKIPIVVLLCVAASVGFLSRDAADEDQDPDDADSLDAPSKKNNSDIYFNVLFILFGTVILWMHMWIVTLMLVPLSFSFLKKLHSIIEIVSKITSFYSVYKNVIFPHPVPVISSSLQKGDKKLHIAILSYLPVITSVVIILLIFTNAMFLMVFVTVKVQQESLLAVQIASNVINETVSKNPEYKSWLPDNETLHRTMDSVVDKVYLEGREWISQKVKASTTQSNNFTEVEKQIVKIWDDIYHNMFVEKLKPKRRMLRRNSWNSEGAGLVSRVMVILNMSEVASWLQENVSALMSVFETVLAILQSNISLILTTFSVVTSAILNGGTIILNLLLSFVIFFTTLFHLLSVSDEQYKPIQVVGAAIKPFFSDTPFESALQDALSGVFGASLKMFGFYGLYTWVNHSMMGANLVYMPSVLAAMFGVVPLLTTYWVCIPAALEIWLLQGSLFRAICLVVFQLLPTFLVDAAIYQDISSTGGGGHPYITGLAVAGGVYTFGLEGAIAGPLVLCFLLVLVNMYAAATQ